MSSTANMMPKQLPHGRAPSSRRNIERPLPCEATAAKQDTPHASRGGYIRCYEYRTGAGRLP